MKNLYTLLITSILYTCSYAQVNKTRIDETLAAKGIQAQDLSYVITSQYTSKNNGVTHVYLRQTFNGVEIFNANSALHFNQNGNLLSFNNGFIQGTANRVRTAKKTISYAQALNTVAAQLDIAINISSTKTSNYPNEYIVNDKAVTSKEIKTKLYYLFQNKQLFQVWNVEIYIDKKGDWWNKRVDAESGFIIDENNWKTSCNTQSVQAKIKKNDFYAFDFDDDVELKKSGNGTYRVFAFPIESPLKGQRQLVNSSATTLASPYGWHDVNGSAGAEYTITRGNNVWAKEDTLDQDSSNGFAPDGGTSLLFDFPMDSNANPSNYVRASITNLFYWNNVIHDVFFRYGFDEESGNFQNTNYSLKGEGDDYVFADAQDGSGTNNANFSTPPDGYNPRMQMFIWKAGTSNNIFYITSPDSLKGKYLSATAAFGPVLNQTGVSGNLVIALDATVDSNLCCSTIINNLSGKIALIDRGDCFFVNKVYNAQLAGAKAAVIINNTPGAPFTMGSSGTGIAKLISIPSIMITKSLGDRLKNDLLANVTIHAVLVDSSGGPKFYDSDFDNGVIIHESAHGLSNRLTGGPQNSSCLYNAEQGGEGWSDFFALALTAKATDNPQSGRGVGTYLIGEDTNGTGIRDYPYSRNMSVNPSTYNSIKSDPEVHFVGFVWCTMLYDIFWDMVDKYGFSNDIYGGNGGNNKAIQLVMDGLKLQPCMPGFVDSRDAILLADSINNNFGNYDLLWKAFARRGLGFYADQGSSDDVSDGVQSFALPPEKPSGIEVNLKANNVEIYPNPTHGMITIEIKGSTTIDRISVFDLTGKLVYSNSEKIQTAKTSIDLSGLSNGVYFIRAIADDCTYTQKIVIN
ncbi:MAG: T9SS-dependent M36 family metallopeptidase [Bacteroidota bacterium]|nr:T9SS-dependent M36 family metallopeptidase [Bacteroidota bacterium]